MRILFLTQVLPFPPDAGPKVKTWHVLRYLAGRGHNIVLASFSRPEEGSLAVELQSLCEEVHLVPLQRSRVRDAGYWLKSHITKRPFLVERDDVSRMRNLVDDLSTSGAVDVIHADQLTMAQFALAAEAVYSGSHHNGNHHASAVVSFQTARHPARIFDAHNAVWKILDQMKDTVPPYLKPLVAVESQRIKHYEGRVVRNFDHTLTVSEIDREALQEASGLVNREARGHAEETGPSLNGAQFSVIPIAVDTGSLQPVPRISDSFNILTLGTLHYPPNADGIRWFAREVFPIVREREPKATLTIVGKNPPGDLIGLAEDSGGSVEVTGYVPDLEPYMKQAAMVVVPVRAGGGMRVRILESFARAMPTITTTIGLEGIEAKPGEHVLVADTADGFAKSVLAVFMDKGLQASLSVSGRWLAEIRYDWKVVLRKLDEVYAGVEETRND